MKTCWNCGKTYTLDGFTIRKDTIDGCSGKCKKCRNKEQLERYHRLKLNPEWISKVREKARIQNRKRLARGEILQSSEEVKLRWYHRNKHKTHASIKAARALSRGLIQPKTTCELCGATPTKLAKHHTDYSRPLSVTFLCTACHGLVHQKDYQGPFKLIPQLAPL